MNQESRSLQALRHQQIDVTLRRKHWWTNWRAKNEIRPGSARRRGAENSVMLPVCLCDTLNYKKSVAKRQKLPKWSKISEWGQKTKQLVKNSLCSPFRITASHSHIVLLFAAQQFSYRRKSNILCRGNVGVQFPDMWMFELTQLLLHVLEQRRVPAHFLLQPGIIIFAHTLEASTESIPYILHYHPWVCVCTKRLYFSGCYHERSSASSTLLETPAGSICVPAKSFRDYLRGSLGHCCRSSRPQIYLSSHFIKKREKSTERNKQTNPPQTRSNTKKKTCKAEYRCRCLHCKQ